MPIEARPATVKYRAVKYFKRHKIGVLAASLILLSLIGGLIISIRQTNIARAEEQKALREAEKSKKITGFMEKILNYANPLWYAEGGKSGGQAKLIEILDDITDKIETEFPNDADVRAELHHKAAEIYLANGNYPKSLFHAERALETRRSLLGDQNVETAKDKYYLGSVYFRFRKVNGSVKLHEEAAQTFREIAPDNANLPYLLEDLSTLYRSDLKDFERAEKVLTESLELFRAKDGENHYNTVRQYFHLSFLFAEKSEIAQSEEYFREGANRLKNLSDAALRNRLPIFLAMLEQAKGNGQTAEKILEDFLARRDSDSFSQNVKDAESHLEQFYGANKNYEKLIELQIRLLKNLNPNLPSDKLLIGYKKTDIALGFYNLGRLKEAEIYFNEGYEIYRNMPADISMIFYDSKIAESFFYQKNYEKARPILEKICNFYKENFPPEDGQILRYQEMLKKSV